jgi:Protein of unknown function (DUF3095)
MTDDRLDFYESLPILTDFAAAVKAKNYRPVPDDWVVGFADVVGSTRAIAEERYRAVNFASAGVIAAIANALGRRPFPFVFLGDAASFATPGSEAATAKEALARMAAYAAAEFELDLRAALIPAAEARATGRDVRVARFGASKACVYAMFAGGGMAWFEDCVRRGQYAIPSAARGARPDLAGLSCRWISAPAKHGIVASLIVAPRGDDPHYAGLVQDIVGLVAKADGSGRPVTADRLDMGDPGAAIALEGSAIKASGTSAFGARLKAAANYALGYAIHRFKLKAGGFDAELNAADVAANADFRKFDDSLRMTIDCSHAFADKLEARLAAADDYADWGLHRQRSVQITSYAPSITDRGPLHFVDGAEGGYTLAASAMKARRLLKAEAV